MPCEVLQMVPHANNLPKYFNFLIQKSENKICYNRVAATYNKHQKIALFVSINKWNLVASKKSFDRKYFSLFCFKFIFLFFNWNSMCCNLKLLILLK